MRTALHTVFAIAVLASNTVDGGCAPSTGSALPGACQVDTSGIRVVDGAVVDVLTVRCDPQPLRHVGWLEHRRDPGQAYAQLDASSWVTTIPDTDTLRLFTGTPVHRLVRTTFDQNERPIEVYMVILPGDRHVLL
ncbi:MAG: hypothetical protein ACRDTE_05455, partial [Pseudonocardiaceae bacterium]